MSEFYCHHQRTLHKKISLKYRCSRMVKPLSKSRNWLDAQSRKLLAETSNRRGSFCISQQQFEGCNACQKEQKFF